MSNNNKDKTLDKKLDKAADIVVEDTIKNPTQDLEAQPDKEEKVVINKSELESIMSRLADLEKATPIQKARRLGNRTAKVRFIEGRIVKGYGKTWDKTEVGGSKYMMIEVFDVDDNKYEVKYLDFVETGEHVEAEIVSVTPIEEEETLGSTSLKKVDYQNFKTETTGEQVPLVVRTCKYNYKMKLPNGKIVELPEEALN